nr:sigma-70 family RNA polymerase sigma factor [Caldilineaceae bacterium]
LAYRVAYRILRRKDLVADAVQEAFLKAYRALLTFRGEHFKSWLMRIVVNICYDLLRVCRRQATASLDALSIAPEYVRSLTDPAERPEAYVERMELRQRIEVGLCALPPEQQAAVVLCDIHGYSYAEMADMMGVAMGTVKSRLARGRSRLAAYLLEHELLS